MPTSAMAAAALNPNAPAFVPTAFLIADGCFPSPSRPCCYTAFNPYQSQAYFVAPPPPPAPPCTEVFGRCLPPEFFYFCFPLHEPAGNFSKNLPCPLLPQPQQGFTSTEEEWKEVPEKPQENLANNDKYLGGFVTGDHSFGCKRKGSAPRRGSRSKRVVARHCKREVTAELELRKMEFGAGNDDENKTTVMIKNLPNKFTKEKVLRVLDQHCFEENQKLQKPSRLGDGEEAALSEFDFLYLPIDFKSGSNKGYAFVNLTSAAAARRLYNFLHNYSWKPHGSPKVCQVTYARIQGLPALLKHLKSSVFICDSDEFLPVCFAPARNGCVHSEETRIGRRLPGVPVKPRKQ